MGRNQRPPPPIPNPPNPVHDLPNRHQLFLGLTGSGKSQALRQLAGIPTTGARVVLLDPSRDHPRGTHYYSDRGEFARALAEADASGRGFRIAYDGIRTPEFYDWWCRCCASILDGRKTTYLVTEELAAVSRGPGAAMPAHQWLLNESRKYGGIYLATTQFPTQIPKVVYDNSHTLYFGLTAPRLRRKYADHYGFDLAELAGLEPLQFLRWHLGKVEKVQITYKKPHLLTA